MGWIAKDGASKFMEEFQMKRLKKLTALLFSFLLIVLLIGIAPVMACDGVAAFTTVQPLAFTTVQPLAFTTPVAAFTTVQAVQTVPQVTVQAITTPVVSSFTTAAFVQQAAFVQPVARVQRQRLKVVNGNCNTAAFSANVQTNIQSGFQVERITRRSSSGGGLGLLRR